MRPLHRPMFRYGGPIKEGIMSGIRESKRQGGSMGTHAALVGNPIFPKTAGREHHQIDYRFNPKDLNPKKIKSNIVVGGTKKLVRNYAPKLEGIGGRTVDRLKNWWTKIKPTKVPRLRRTDQTLPIGMRGSLSSSGITSIPLRSRILPWMRKNPGWTAAGGIGATSEPGQAILKAPFGIAKWTGEALTPKWAEKYLPWEVPGVESAYKTPWSPEEKIEIDEGDKSIFEEEKIVTEPKKSADEIRAERIQKYRDIMDIKGMNKRAAYDSLIDASKLIQESGDFKGDIKSGKLINDIIQATSKQFDKPSKTKDAIDTLILKGEIEKDIKSSMPTEAEKTAAAFGISKEDYAKKLLGKSSPAEIIANISTKTGRVDSTTVASGYKASGIVPKATITDTIIDEWIDDKDGRTAIDYVKEVISKADGFGPGLYVVGDRAVLFDGTNYSYDY
jgi:hypothetical protein